MPSLYASVFQTKALNTWSETNRNQAAIDSQSVLLLAILGFHLNGDIVAIVLDRGGLVAGQQLNAELLILLRNFLRHVCIFIRQHAVHKFYDGDVHAVVRQNVGELHTDGASAHDHHGFWCVFVGSVLRRKQCCRPTQCQAGS